MTTVETNGASGKRSGRPTNEEMEKRVKRVLAIFNDDPTPIDEPTIAQRLGLESTQSVTLINKMLRRGDLAIASHQGRRRFFGPGDGTPVPVEKHVRKLRSVDISDLLSEISVGQNLQIRSIGLDESNRTVVTFRNGSGKILELLAS